MVATLAQQPVGSLVRERQSRANVFERFGIDYCCHGHAPLEEACSSADIPLEDVCSALDASDASTHAHDDTDWSQMSLMRLIDDIVKRHHAYLRERLPLLARMIDRVVAAHGDRHSELQAVREVFTTLQNELTSHMMKEERVLFPIIIELERAAAGGRPAPQFHCGSVTYPIAVMEHEHDDAGEALNAMRRLTDDFHAPDDACETYRALMTGLRNLESDLHLHIHKENNVLFPRAAELEAAVAYAN